MNLKSMSSPSLKKAKISWYNKHLGQIECNQCSQVWSPNLLSGGRMPKGWWKCPNGCNTN